MSEETTTDTIVVIVVEDEPLIRMVLAEALLDDGFDVIEATHAREAITILEIEAARVHALFTDVHMPGDLDGVGLVHHARVHLAVAFTFGDIRPGIPQDKHFASGNQVYRQTLRVSSCHTPYSGNARGSLRTKLGRLDNADSLKSFPPSGKMPLTRPLRNRN